MGNCASPQYSKRGAVTLNYYRQTTAKIVDIDGRLQEFKQPIKANYILSQNPNCFLCSSESMYINSYVPHVPDGEELQLGQIYFLMPLSKSHLILSLQDLCALAIKASAALAQSDSSSDYSSKKTMSYPLGRGVKLVAGGQRFCKTSIGINIVGVDFPPEQGNRQIEL